jgi:hypothetical protein
MKGIDNDEHYGNSYVKDKYIQAVIKSLGINNNQYCKYPKASRGFQEIYIITNNVTNFD